MLGRHRFTPSFLYPVLVLAAFRSAETTIFGTMLVEANLAFAFGQLEWRQLDRQWSHFVRTCCKASGKFCHCAVTGLLHHV